MAPPGSTFILKEAGTFKGFLGKLFGGTVVLGGAALGGGYAWQKFKESYTDVPNKDKLPYPLIRHTDGQEYLVVPEKDVIEGKTLAKVDKADGKIYARLLKADSTNTEEFLKEDGKDKVVKSDYTHDDFNKAVQVRLPEVVKNLEKHKNTSYLLHSANAGGDALGLTNKNGKDDGMDFNFTKYLPLILGGTALLGGAVVGGKWGWIVGLLGAAGGAVAYLWDDHIKKHYDAAMNKGNTPGNSPPAETDEQKKLREAKEAAEKAEAAKKEADKKNKPKPKLETPPEPKPEGAFLDKKSQQDALAAVTFKPEADRGTSLSALPKAVQKEIGNTPTA